MANNLKTTTGGGTSSIGELDEFSRWKMHTKFGNDENLTELRQRVPWLFRGVEIIADATSRFPFEIRDDADNVIFSSMSDVKKRKTTKSKITSLPTKHEYLKDIKRLIWLTSASLTMRGKAYVFPAKNKLITKELRYWVSDTIRPRISKEIGLEGFIRVVNGIEVQFDFNGTISSLIPPDQLIYFWLPDDSVEIGPPNIYPAQAAMNAAGVLFNLDAFFNQHAKSGLVKAFLATMKGLPAGDAGRDERKRVQDMLSRMMTGLRNIGRVVVAEAEGTTIVPVGEGFSEMKDVPITEDKRTDIAIALGIPASILWSDQTSGLGGRGVVDEDTNRLYRNKVEPHFGFISDELNQQHFETEGLRVVALPEMLDAYQENEVNRSQAFSNYNNSTGNKIPDLWAETLGIDLPEGKTYQDLVPPEPQPVPPALANVNPFEPKAKPNAANEEPTTSNLTQGAKTLRIDLDKWQRKSINNLKTNGAALCDFESDVILASDATHIKSELAQAQNIDSIKTIFARYMEAQPSDAGAPFQEYRTRLAEL